MRRTAVAACLVLALWLIGVATAVLPIPLGGTYPGLVASFALWTAVILGCAGLGVLSRRRWLTVTGVVGAVVLYAVSFNWVVLAPRAWFDVHRPMYEAAVDDVDRSDTGLYGGRLPLRWWWLTVDGRAAVSPSPDGTSPDAVFFAQWYGVPDDGGGYFWSPGRSPEGYDMAGMTCLQPVDLGDGWWMCGMG